MSKHRLINCEFVNASSFKVNMSNRAKLLYLFMIFSADDRGFVDTTQDLINTLDQNDEEMERGKICLELLENTYTSALNELLQKGYLYEFIDNHSNKVYLIRHWYYHNKYRKGLWTNYRNYLEQVSLKNGSKYEKKPLKENKIKEKKVNENNINEISDEEIDNLVANYSIDNEMEQEQEPPMSEQEINALLETFNENGENE